MLNINGSFFEVSCCYPNKRMIINGKTQNMNDQTFKDKVVVINGATGGVGRATAWEFAKQGAKVVLLARGQEQLDVTKKEVEQYGSKALCIPTDVADPDAVEA